MKKALYKLLSFFFIVGFLFYWIGVFILALPSNYTKDVLRNVTPRYNSFFGNSWKFFSPPFTYTNRLYYIVREIAHPNKIDTIEVIQNISKQKQQKAPFNQKENIIDNLINHEVASIIYVVWKNNGKPSENAPETADSTYIANTIAAVADNITYQNNRTSLLNYGSIVLKENKIDTAGKQIKIIITEKKIRPFKYMSDINLSQKEMIFFETSFNPIKKW